MTVLLRLPVYVEPHIEPEPVYDRPKTRADCLPGGLNEERPCPFMSCRYHLYEEVSGNVEVEQMTHTCTLDVADEGGLTLEEVGGVLRLTRERIRQIEEVALRKIRKRGRFD